MTFSYFGERIEAEVRKQGQKVPRKGLLAYNL
jgi:hypothetical protein